YRRHAFRDDADRALALAAPQPAVEPAEPDRVHAAPAQFEHDRLVDLADARHLEDLERPRVRPPTRVPAGRGHEPRRMPERLRERVRLVRTPVHEHDALARRDERGRVIAHALVPHALSPADLHNDHRDQLPQSFSRDASPGTTAPRAPPSRTSGSCTAPRCPRRPSPGCRSRTATPPGSSPPAPRTPRPRSSFPRRSAGRGTGAARDAPSPRARTALRRTRSDKWATARGPS